MTSNWETVRLGEVFQLSNSRLGAHEDEPPVFAISKYDGVVLSSDYHDKRVASAKLDTYKVVDADAWAYSTIHIDEGSIARNKHGFSGVVSPMYTIMNWTSCNQDPSYFELLLRSPNMLTIYGDFAQGSINRRKSLPWKTFSELQVPVPSLAEQRRIVDLIGALDDAIEAATDQNDAIEAIRLELANAACLVENTVTRSISSLGKTMTGGTPSSKNEEFWSSADVPFVTAGDMDKAGGPILHTSRFLSDQGATALRRVAPAHAVLQVCIGASVGKVGILPYEASFNQQINAVTGLGMLDAAFMGLILSASTYQSLIGREAGSSTMPIISKGKWEKTEIPWPQEPIRNAYAESALALSDAIEMQVLSIDGLKKLRSEMLTSLLSGGHTIPESYDELLEAVDA